MYHVMDHCGMRDTFIADAEHYGRLNATVVHDRVVGVDVAGHNPHLESGGDLAYGKLLIASGARGRRLGVENEDAAGIYDFLGLADAEAIAAELPHVRKPVVIGGGLIGAEIAEVFHSHGQSTPSPCTTPTCSAMSC
jgi:NADPH-dependent 2,4-dienoyl-CoA reductase/sulfur reductase-like enzyme